METGPNGQSAMRFSPARSAVVASCNRPWSMSARIRELRGLLEAFNTAKRTAWQTLVRMVTTGFILALVAGALIKLKLFGGGH